MSDNAGVAMAREVVADVELLSLVQTGEQEAFRSIYNRYFKEVGRIAMRFLGSREPSEDAVQATFMVLWQRSKEIVFADTSLMPWLATVCRLQCRNIQKKEGRRQHFPLKDFSYDGAAESLGVTRSVVRNRLSRLKLNFPGSPVGRAVAKYPCWHARRSWPSGSASPRSFFQQLTSSRRPRFAATTNSP